MRLRSFLLKQAIKRCLRKKPHEAFAESPSKDSYICSLSVGARDTLFAVDELFVDKLAVRKWHPENRKYQQDELPMSVLNTAGFSAVRYLEPVTTKYSSLFDFWRSELTLVAPRAVLAERLRQAIFNRKTKFRSDRISVLKKIVERYQREAEHDGIRFIVGGDEYTAVISHFEHVYGQRIFLHPSFNRELASFWLIMDSLSSSGDLEKSDQSDFKLNGQALATIAEFELSEQRHSDQKWHNWLIFALTFVLAAAAITQVYLTDLAMPSP